MVKDVLVGLKCSFKKCYGKRTHCICLHIIDRGLWGILKVILVPINLCFMFPRLFSQMAFAHLCLQQKKYIWRGCGELERCASLVSVYSGTATVENRVEVPQKVKIELPYKPAVPLLGGIYPEEFQAGSRRDVCTMFTAALLITAKSGEQPRCTHR